MPYIPPPRPPSIPKPAPVFRPPTGPNLAFQQQQRLQQQQRFQQHLRFQQQQQQRLQQTLQADHMRRQQQQQQFLQQQEQLRRQQHQIQQDHLRRQQHQIQQDNHRRQQQHLQDHLRRQQNYQRQHQLLHNFQHSADLGGSTVFHISPAVSIQASSTPPGGFQMSPEGFQYNSNGIQVNLEEGYSGVGSLPNETQLPPSSPPPTSQSLPPQGSPYLQPTSQISAESLPFKQPQHETPSPGAPPPEATPSNGSVAAGGPYVGVHAYTSTALVNQASAPQAGATGLPLPYPDSSLPPTAIVPAVPPAQHPAMSSNMQGAASPSVGVAHPASIAEPGNVDDRIVLVDGTQIIVQQDDEFLFIGPTGQQMVINCLPLYDPLPQAATSPPPPDSSFLSTPESKNKTTLRKAHSEEILAKSSTPNGEEEDNGSKSDGEDREEVRRNVSQQTRFRSSFSANYTTKIHNVPPPTQASARVLEMEGSTSTAMEASLESTIVFVAEAAGTKTSDEGKQKEGSEIFAQVDPLQHQNGQPIQVSNGAKESLHGEAVNPTYQQNVERKQHLESASSTEANAASQSDSKTNSRLRTVSEGSDTDESNSQNISVNYIDNPEDLKPQLKRSSGSVSFIGACAVSPLQPSHIDKKIEEGEETEGRTEPSKNGITSVKEKTVEEENGNEVPGSELQNELSTSPKPSEASAEDSSKTATTFTSPTEKPPILEEANLQVSQPNAQPSAPFHPGQNPSAALRQLTLLPPSPPTVEPTYIERSGWLTKLSHRKGVFRDKWQKRYFVLHGSWLYYFKKYGDSTPRGVIRLLPSGWIKAVPQGTPRMPDAVANVSEQNAGIVSVLRCIAVHRPSNYAASLSALLSTAGVAEAFRSQTVSVTSPQYSSRTYYMIAPSNEERDAWVKSIQANMTAYSHSPESLTTACKELKSMLRAVKSNVPIKDIPSLLLLLHQKKKEVAWAHSESCSHTS